MKLKKIHVYLFYFFIVIVLLLIYAFNRFQINNAYSRSEEHLNDSYVRDVYEEHSEIFKFTDDGEAIISVRELFKAKPNLEFEIKHDKDGNDCIGYYIVNKDEELDYIFVDSSHVCDMIDY